jgi:hypothetical protein
MNNHNLSKVQSILLNSQLNEYYWTLAFFFCSLGFMGVSSGFWVLWGLWVLWVRKSLWVFFCRLAELFLCILHVYLGALFAFCNKVFPTYQKKLNPCFQVPCIFFLLDHPEKPKKRVLQNLNFPTKGTKSPNKKKKTVYIYIYIRQGTTNWPTLNANYNKSTTLIEYNTHLRVTWIWYTSISWQGTINWLTLVNKHVH